MSQVRDRSLLERTLDGDAFNRQRAKPATSEKPSDRAPLPFEFTGKAVEYFKIWIVNVCLTVLTLGVYSAWAKVRTTRYFYGNTSLDGSSFDYLAKPIAILKGRVIAFVILAAYALVVSLFPPGEPIFWVMFLFALPWLVVKALSFRAHNTAYRNVRFDFRGSLREATLVYIGFMVFLTFITAGLAFPYFVYRQSRFAVLNSAYGQTDFGFEATAGRFFSVYAKAAGGAILGIIGMFAVFYLAQQGIASLGIDSASSDPKSPEIVAAKVVIITIPIYLWFFFLGVYVRTAVANLVWNHASVGKHRLRSDLRVGKMLSIYLTNAFAIIFSLGLAIPWAKVRLAHYRVQTMSLIPASDLDDFVAGENAEIGAAGEGIGEAFDVDLGL
ncbi:MAG: YjgN family protein [Gammaproteobacteria bacterium]